MVFPPTHTRARTQRGTELIVFDTVVSGTYFKVQRTWLPVQSTLMRGGASALLSARTQLAARTDEASPHARSPRLGYADVRLLCKYVTTSRLRPDPPFLDDSLASLPVERIGKKNARRRNEFEKREFDV